jgi:hypothetical protein
MADWEYEKMWMVGRRQALILGISMVALYPLSAGLADGGLESNRAANSFEECVAESGRILKMYPPKCVTKGGRVFIETPKTSKVACKNLCGDGQCQEIVCMAVGCPCAENHATCPKDCAE